MSPIDLTIRLIVIPNMIGNQYKQAHITASLIRDNNMTDFLLVYITCADIQEAKKIGRHLLNKRLSACVNIFPSVNPMFLWPPKTGHIDQSHEVVLLVKTLESKFEQVEAEVTKIHSFDTPCIIAWPVTHVAKKYQAWFKTELE